MILVIAWERLNWCLNALNFIWKHRRNRVFLKIFSFSLTSFRLCSSASLHPITTSLFLLNLPTTTHPTNLSTFPLISPCLSLISCGLSANYFHSRKYSSNRSSDLSLQNSLAFFIFSFSFSIFSSKPMKLFLSRFMQ